MHLASNVLSRGLYTIPTWVLNHFLLLNSAHKVSIACLLIIFLPINDVISFLNRIYSSSTIVTPIVAEVITGCNFFSPLAILHLSGVHVMFSFFNDILGNPSDCLMVWTFMAHMCINWNVINDIHGKCSCELGQYDNAVFCHECNESSDGPYVAVFFHDTVCVF